MPQSRKNGVNSWNERSRGKKPPTIVMEYTHAKSGAEQNANMGTKYDMTTFRNILCNIITLAQYNTLTHVIARSKNDIKPTQHWAPACQIIDGSAEKLFHFGTNWIRWTNVYTHTLHTVSVECFCRANASSHIGRQPLELGMFQSVAFCSRGARFDKTADSSGLRKIPKNFAQFQAENGGKLRKLSAKATVADYTGYGGRRA